MNYSESQLASAGKQFRIVLEVHLPSQVFWCPEINLACLVEDIESYLYTILEDFASTVSTTSFAHLLQVCHQNSNVPPSFIVLSGSISNTRRLSIDIRQELWFIADFVVIFKQLLLNCRALQD